MNDRILIVGGKGVNRYHGTRAVMKAFNTELFQATKIWDRRPQAVYASTWGVSVIDAINILSDSHIQFLVGGPYLEPRLDPFECAACGSSGPYTWMDPDLFLDEEHIELFGRRLLCLNCWKSPMGEVLTGMERRLRPPSRWDLLMDREETCLT